MKTKYKRVLLKLSGESLLGSDPFGINPAASAHIAEALKEMRTSGLEVAVVIGGGNIFRGAQLNALGMERTPADQIGMLSTIMNGIALQQTLTHIGCESRVYSALECPKVVEPYTWRAATEALNRNKIVIFVGGTGNPYFTTDTAAALRASEIKADVMLKATKVDGIYDKDPLKFPNAKMYRHLTYEQALADNLQVMDGTSIALCRSNKIPIYVFNMKHLKEKNLSGLIHEQSSGTLVTGD